MSSLEQIYSKLSEYKKRYYKRQILLGSLLFLITSLSLFLLLSYLEYELWMNSSLRTFLFYFYIIYILSSSILLIIKPLIRISNASKHIDNREAANEIALFFPEIEDRLINILELGHQNQADNALIAAAIEKKAQTFKTIQFAQAVDFSVAKKYLGGTVAVLVCFLLVSFINPEIIKDSPKRIANYTTAFEKDAPFQFNILNDELTAFKGEDFSLSFQIEGSSLPGDVSIYVDGQKRKTNKKDNSNYNYTFERIQTDKTVYFDANGFRSKAYTIQVLERPDLLSMSIEVQSPNYTGGDRRTITNTGDLTILEGSSVTWVVNTLATKEALHVYNGDTATISLTEENQFTLNKRISASGAYEIMLRNEHSRNNSSLQYDVRVIKDQYPKINVDYFPDSSSFQYLAVAGSVADDYGFSYLQLHYRESGSEDFSSIPLEINLNSNSQSFYANWSLDTLTMESGSRLEVYVSVADNDQVNGAKTTRSNTFILEIPTDEEIDDLLSKKEEVVEDGLNDSKEKSEEIAARLSEIEDRLKTDNQFDWQEKKMLEDVIKDREELNKQLNELEKKNQDLRNSADKFRNQSSEQQKKNEQLQQLMEQLMDEETKKLYEQLKQLLKENAPKDQIAEQLQQLQRNEQNLERDMERALELFKRLKMENALAENLQKLDTLSNRQEEVSKLDEQENAEQAQNDINKQFEDFREKMDEVLDMNQELKRPEALEDFEYEERQIARELREIEEMMKEMRESEKGNEDGENGEKNESGEQNSEQSKQQQKNMQQKQQNAAQKMKSLSQKLSTMQGGMQMEMMQANLDQLRDILDNLIKLSFNQEDNMQEMRQVNQSDPRFLELSQDQLKLKDDAKVIQDSLLSLASRVVQISSFVTREVDQINQSVNEAISHLKDRNRGRALTSQQFAMTSINNLALLLDDTMQQMQMSMSEAMGSGSDQQQQSQGLPDMQELQNQLGEQINELKGSGKSGRELSEELARLAAEQEMIRQQLEMLKQAEEGRPGGGQVGDELQKAIDMMEQNEVDLVNKRLTEQLIFRQKQITTRLLEANKAKREQETEEEREAETPSMISREIPPEFEEYLKLKKKEIELLKTIPIELNPFYKKEVNDYFRRISTEDPND